MVMGGTATAQTAAPAATAPKAGPSTGSSAGSPGNPAATTTTTATLTVDSTVRASVGRALNLEQALRQGLAVHPSVVAKARERDAAAKALESARWQRYPAPSLQTSADQNGSVVTTARVEQPLWSAGRITADIDAAQARLNAAELAVREAQQSLLVRIASAFSELLRLQSRLEGVGENIAEHERLLALIRRRADSEVAAESEVIMARARLEQARAERLATLAQAANARAELEQIIGERASELLAPRLVLQLPGSLDDTVTAAVEQSPQLRRLGAEREAAEAELRARKSAWWPQLLARLERNWGGSATSSASYLVLSVQPGRGLSAQSNVEESAQRVESLRAGQDASRKDVADQARTNWNQLQSAAAEAAVYRELVEATRQIYESFVRQFPAGRKSWLEVLNARREATQARMSLADAQWGGYLARLRLDIAAGRISADTINLPSESKQP